MTPEGWRRVHLSDVADQRIEKVVPARTDTRPYVALEHLAPGSPTLRGWSKAGAAASAKTLFRTGDVLFGKLRPYLRKAAPAPFDGLCSTDILPLFGRNRLDTRYLAQLAQWCPLQQHAVATSSGTKMPNTSWAQLGGIHVRSPTSPRAARDCRHPLLGGRRHREDPGSHRPGAGRQARPNAGAAHAGACRGGTRGSSRRILGRYRSAGKLRYLTKCLTVLKRDGVQSAKADQQTRMNGVY